MLTLLRSALLLLGFAVLASDAAAASPPLGEGGVAKVECREARYPPGSVLTGKESAAGQSRGDVVAIDRIINTSVSRTVGFRYTTREGRTFVADRPSAHVQTIDLAIMNQLVEAMGYFHGNAFDPRDNGFVYYAVTWKPALAKAMHLELVRCR
jgi:hypothetical protein